MATSCKETHLPIGKKNQDGFSLRFFNGIGAGGFNPCINLRFFNTIGAGGFNPCIETDFSTPLEQAVLTPAIACIPASEKRNILLKRIFFYHNVHKATQSVIKIVCCPEKIS
jgi:hypothetical protein